MGEEPLRIDWESAEVADGTLCVDLQGDPPPRLGKRFDAIAALIEPKAGGWGEIAVRKGSITVSEVQEGAEADLRHLLESVVLQLNSDLGLGPDGDGPQAPAEGERQRAGGADREMGERFRSFGGREG